MNPRNETYRLSLTEADRVFAQQIESLSDLRLETRKLHDHAIREFLNSGTQAGSRKCRSVIINESQIVRWVTRTSSKLAPSYAAKKYQAVDRYCDALVEAGLLPTNPLAAFKAHHGNQSWERIAQAAQSTDPEGALANLRVEPLPPGPLEEHLQAYIRLNRAVGKHYKRNEQVLTSLDHFLRSRAVTSAQTTTTEALQGWLDGMTCSPIVRFQRAHMARRFFKYLVAQGVIARNPLDEGPLGGERRPRNTPFRPFIFTQAQIAAILAAAKQLPPNHLFPLRPQVCYTMIRLLYALGLRLGEALRLCLQDVDLDRGTLLIRQTKFHKSRLLPFGPRIRDCLRQYLVARRNVLQPPRGEDPLFVALWRRPMGAATIGAAFHNLLAEVGLRKRKGVRGPRVHDLRHAFAVHRLLRWYREDVDVQSRLMLLATFMGHVEIRSTEVYLTITAELLQEASNRFHRGFGSVIRKEV